LSLCVPEEGIAIILEALFGDIIDSGGYYTPLELVIGT